MNSNGGNDSALGQLQRACAYIEWSSDLLARRGTGYLIRPDLVATCHHVVAGAGQDTVIHVRLPDGAHEGRVLQAAAAADCAVVALTTPALGLDPLPLGGGCASNEPFWVVGFPEVALQAPLPLTGHVIAAEWPDLGGAPAILLYSPQIAAGQGARPQGFSGSPVLMGGRCVGHLKSIIPGQDGAGDRPYAQMGFLYACPSSSLQKLVPGLPLLERRSQAMVPTRASLRTLILEVTRGDVNFDRFFQDYYPETYNDHVTNGMDLVTKMSCLLRYHADERVEILDRLRKEFPKQVSKHEGKLEYEPAD